MEQAEKAAEIEQDDKCSKLERADACSRKLSAESIEGTKTTQDKGNSLLPELSVGENLEGIGTRSSLTTEAANDSSSSLTRRAVDAANLSDSSARIPWHIINSMFQAAETASENDLKPYGGIKQANVLAETLKLHLGAKYDAWRVSNLLKPERDSAPGENADLRRRLMSLSYDQVVDTLKGNNGIDLQKSLVSVFSSEDLQIAQNVSMLQALSKSAVEVRKQYALAASKYGFEDNNDSLKKFAIEKLESISTLDPVEFSRNAELKGMQSQAKREERMQLNTDEAEALAYVDAAIESVRYLTMTPIPGLIPPGSLKEEQKDRVATQVEAAGSLDKARTSAELSHFVESNEAKYKSLVGDAVGLGVTLATKWGLTKQISSLPLPGYARAAIGFAGALFAGGLANSAASGQKIETGLLRNAGVSALAYGGFKSFQYNPEAASNFGRLGKIIARDLATGYAIGASYDSLDYATGLKSWDNNALKSINASGLGFGLSAGLAIPVYSMPFAVSGALIAPRALEAMGQLPRYLYDGAKIGVAPVAEKTDSHWQAQTMKEVLSYKSEHMDRLTAKDARPKTKQ